MENFDLYIHGVPVGHEIVGNSEEHDYIKGFYNHDVKVEVSSLLQIDIVNGKSFYTYLRKKDVRNVEGRPGSYFGLTVSFAGRYCTNVQVLYNILDTIYKKICVGCLIKSDADTDKFLVKQISTSSYKSYSVLDYINAVFKENLENLTFGTLKVSSNSNTEIKFSLKEVDSPLFHETLQQRRILISPEYETASVAYNSLLKELEPIKNENAQLKSENTQLTEKNEKLSKEVERLETEKSNTEVLTSKKYEKQLEEQEARLEEYKQKREELESKIERVFDNIKSIDKPFKELTRLLADRFQEKNEKVGKKTSESHCENRTRHSKTSWSQLVNIILLLVVACLCGYCCYVVSTLSTSVDVIRQNNQEEMIQIEPDSVFVNTADGVYGETLEDTAYDDFKDCRIDISNYNEGNVLKPGSSHNLSIRKKNESETANVPVGIWKSSEGITITQNTFVVDDLKTDDTLNVKIDYIVDSKIVKSRIIKVKK